MNEELLQYAAILGGLFLAIALFVMLLFIRAPYGRHFREGWGPLISNRPGWIIMEAPAAVVFAICFGVGIVDKNLPIVLFFTLWELHYVHRAFIYPWTRRGGQKKMPVVVVLAGLAFNAGNAYINGHYLFSLSGGYDKDWLLDVRFLAGAFLFLAGFVINRWSDVILRELRKPGDSGYRIPHGGLFRWVSCPNYFGEIVEWIGWALATWSLAGLAFAVWTIANLAPRARAHHAWYHAHFDEYPAERKALLPLIW